MRLFLRRVLVVVVALISLASVAWSEVNVNVRMPGLRLELSGPPNFIMPPSLGFYVAVGTPYDLYRVSNSYYVFQNNGWYRGTYYNGPWQAVNYRQLPESLRRHNHEEIRAIRDEEYGHYRENRNHYKGKHFKPDQAWKEERRDNRQEDRRSKDNRHGNQEERKQGGHGRGN